MADLSPTVPTITLKVIPQHKRSSRQISGWGNDDTGCIFSINRLLIQWVSLAQSLWDITLTIFHFFRQSVNVWGTNICQVNGNGLPFFPCDPLILSQNPVLHKCHILAAAIATNNVIFYSIFYITQKHSINSEEWFWGHMTYDNTPSWADADLLIRDCKPRRSPVPASPGGFHLHWTCRPPRWTADSTNADGGDKQWVALLPSGRHLVPRDTCNPSGVRLL